MNVIVILACDHVLQLHCSYSFKHELQWAKRFFDCDMIVLTLSFWQLILFRSFMCVVIVFVSRIKRALHEIPCEREALDFALELLYKLYEFHCYIFE